MNKTIEVKFNLGQLSEITGISYKTLYKRYNNGLRGKELCQKSSKQGLIKLNKNLVAMSNELGISYKTLWHRYVKRGYEGDDLTRKPKEMGFRVTRLKPRCKKIVQLDNDNNIIKEYGSVKEVSKLFKNI